MVTTVLMNVSPILTYVTTDTYETVDSGSLATLFIIYAIGGIISIFIYGKIAQRLGYNFWWGLSMFVPLLNIFALGYAVFKQSPNEEALQSLRASGNRGQSSGPYVGPSVAMRGQSQVYPSPPSYKKPTI